MVEQTGHCPYLGLKQNRAIRFASPTPEHRCYVSGEPLEIPVDQSSYCLSQGHVHCPLYMGLSLPTISDPTEQVVTTSPAPGAPLGGLRGWVASLSPRDRAIYAGMLSMLVVIIGIYVIAGLNIFQPDQSADATTPSPSAITAAPGASAPVAAASTQSPTTASEPPTALPTASPTSTPPEATPTDTLIIGPTRVTASATAGANTTTTAETATAGAGTAVAPGATPSPTGAAGQTSSPTPTLSAADMQSRVTLYFGDSVTGQVYVPVQRAVNASPDQLPAAAVRELIAGPRPNGGLQAVLRSDTQLIEFEILNGTAIVNFDSYPTPPNQTSGFYALALTLTEFDEIERVLFQVQDQILPVAGEGPVARPILNPLNPDNLPQNLATVSPLPLYFLSEDGRYDVRIMRLVPRTQNVAEETLNALLAGPGDFDVAVQRVIPEGTGLRNVTIENGTVAVVDFTQEFAGATNRDAAVRTVVESLTTLPTSNEQSISGVRFLVEGRPLSERWGANYEGVIRRGVINAES